MKFVVMKDAKKSIIKEVKNVSPSDDEVLVKLKYVGVCYSEHYDWSTAKEGAAFGHEPLGVIDAVGKNVKGFKVGDKVSGMWGSSLPGTGGMIQYAVVNPENSCLLKIPSNVRDEDMIIEPLACMVSAVSKARITIPGTKVALVGCGYMGCGAIGLLKLRGAYVVGIDIRKESLEDAKRYGADEVYLVDEAKAKFLNGGFEGFDVVMEWGETNESLDLSINLTKQCGQLCIGAYHTGGKRLIDMQQLNVKAVECLSVHPREWPLLIESAKTAVSLLSGGKWNYTNLPVKVYPMNKFDLAQGELETKYGKYMKAIIDMTKEDGEPYII